MATASSSASTSPPRIKVKKEICTDNDTIKELAETAMNDILGWYGYDSVDRLELAANNVLPSTSNITNATAALDEVDGEDEEDEEEGPGVRQKQSSPPARLSSSASSTAAALLKTKSKQSALIGSGHYLARDEPSTSSAVAGGSERRVQRDATSSGGRPGQSGSPPDPTRNGIVLHHQAHQQQQQQQLHHHHHHHHNASAGGESSTSEKDSSRESSKSPMLMKMLTDKQEQTCQWCRKVIPSHQTGILGTTEGMIFCTEACFSQSRRASFKRAKTCDWCRHVRHAVSYVDFQDGASQLQFCSDKCLNQYKMQIFCNETQAHLEMNPHLKEKSTSAGTLITPELWMKNCKSCSISPVSDRSESVSPVPSLPVRSSPEPSPVLLRSPTPAKKPLISVAPASKLLSKSLQPSTLPTRPNPKSSRKRRTGHRPPAGTNVSMSSGKRSTATHQAEYGGAGGGGSGGASSSINNNNNVTIPNNNLLTGGGPGTVPQKPPPSVQDLRILQKKVHGSVVNLAPNDGPPLGAGYDGRDLTGGPLGPPPPPPPGGAVLNIPPQFLPPPLNLLRAPFFPLNPAQLRFPAGLPNLPNAQPPPAPPPPPPMGPPPSPLAGGPLGGPAGSRPPLPNLLGFGGAAPPVTILVPYPIIIPLPLPIPVPIPVIDFLKAALPKGESEKADEKRAEQKDEPCATDATAVMLVDSDETLGGEEAPPPDPPLEDDSDVPLDFTVGSQGKETERDAPTSSRNELWNELPVEPSSPVREPALPTYALSTIVAAETAGDPVPPMGEDEAHREPAESAKRLLPKFKITRLEAGGKMVLQEGVVEGGTKDETDMERERKEMVERSRPLRKRKRLVVQQHLHELAEEHELAERTNDGDGNTGEAQEYRSGGIELRSGNKSVSK
ncbi:phosphatase and actin regulator 4B isoform X2 [Anopheles gambiae]|uniref:phosphatase and actin regulator 4B isoform X2 n=1 Tax=Anopheles gambiae TaxID=7165 RepID=UPI002AC99B73|nr:phosphatase and actin regulator 4B isoform X2 [Anopheles gambiae]